MPSLDQIRRLLLLLFLAVRLCPQVPCQEPPELVYRSVASEVRVVFFVTDAQNHPVQALKANDFAVVDDDRVIRDFRSFVPSVLTKLDVTVLFDSSESVLPHFQQEMTQVLQLISQWPWNPGDYLSVLSFSGMEIHGVCSGDCPASLTADKMASFPRGGATPLFDALDTATSLLRKRIQPDVWPVIILFSDGDDTISKTSFNRAIREVLATRSQVYVVDVGNPRRISNGIATLQRIAGASGGRYLHANEGALRIRNAVFDDLRSAQVVTYTLPRSNSGFHSIRILPTRDLNLRFRSRYGYFHFVAAREENNP